MRNGFVFKKFFRADLKKFFRAAAGICLAAVMTTGCAALRTYEEIPKLHEPTALNYAYRPAEYGTIGDTTVFFGTVVPESHCFFYKSNVRLSGIAVQVGDEVFPGDVLAYADINYAVSQRDALIESLEYENTDYDLNCLISEEELNKLRMHRQEAADAGNGVEAARYDVLIATRNENNRYDAMLHQARVDNYEEQIAKQQEIIDSGTLTADCQGSVTYIKNIADGTYVSADENVVIVSDTSNVYIELNVTFDKYKCSNYEVKYIQVGTRKYEAKEIEYTPQELVIANVQSSYPNVRIACPDGENFNIGDTYPVYYREKNINNVIVVGKDSLYSDDGGSFVYVRTRGQGREKRYIEKGASDSRYAEVLSGVSEGELIFYESNDVVPSDYVGYTVELSDYEIFNYSQNYKVSETVELIQKSEYEGEILELYVSKNQEIAKGDLLYVIKTGEGKAALTEAQYAIEHEKANYEKDIENYDKELERLRGENYPDVACDIRITEYRRRRSVLSHERRLKSLLQRYEELHNGNDGEGNISVYSEFDGVVVNVNAKRLDKVWAGYDIMTVATASNPKMYVEMSENEHSFGNVAVEAGYMDNTADVGELITFDFPNGKCFGECIGWTVGAVNAGKVYLFTDGDGVHLTKSNGGQRAAAGFYVRMSDDADYAMPLNGTVKFLYVNMTEVVVLPSDMVKQDADGGSYVWKLKDGELYKQFVLVDEKLANRQTRVVLSGLEPGDLLAVSY